MFSGAPTQNGGARNALGSPHIIMGRDVDIEEFPYQVIPRAGLFVLTKLLPDQFDIMRSSLV